MASWYGKTVVWVVVSPAQALRWCKHLGAAALYSFFLAPIVLQSEILGKKKMKLDPSVKALSAEKYFKILNGLRKTCECLWFTSKKLAIWNSATQCLSGTGSHYLCSSSTRWLQFD